MNDIEEALKRNEEICRQAEALLCEADATLEKRDQVFADFGITRDAVNRFLESEHVSAEDRARIQEEVTKAEEEFNAREQYTETQQRSTSTAGRKKPRMDRMV